MKVLTNTKKSLQIFIGGIGLFFKKGMFLRSAALAYYSVFALPPMLVLVVNMFNRLNIDGRKSEYIYNEISNLIGEQSADSLKSSVDQIDFFSSGGWQVYASGIILLVTATTVFSVIQKGFNHIFEVQAAPTTWQGVVHFLFSRFLSLSLIIGLGFLMILSLLLDIILNVFKEVLFSSVLTEWMITFTGNVLIPLLLLSLFFSVMFAILPDVKLRFRQVLPIGIYTAILFVAGKYAISFYVSSADYNTVYANAASLVIVLVWCFYGTSLLFLGCTSLKAKMDLEHQQEKTVSYASKTTPNETY